MEDIREFEIELELKDGARRKYKYKTVHGGTTRAKITSRKAGGEKTVDRDERTVQEVEKLIAQMRISKDMSEDQLLETACSALQLRKEDVEHLDVEVEFADGTEIKAERSKS